MTNRVSIGGVEWGSKAEQGPGRRKEEEGSGEREKAVSGMKIRYQGAGGSEVTTLSSSLISYLHP